MVTELGRNSCQEEKPTSLEIVLNCRVSSAKIFILYALWHQNLQCGFILINTAR